MSRRLALLAVAVLMLVATASAETVTVDFLPALWYEDYGVGVTHNINNYTVSSSSGLAGATWQVFGTNDGDLFDFVDSRKDEVFTGGVARQFNVSNAASYRYYYLYAVEGFGIGSTVEIHFDHSVASLSPKESTTQYFNFTQKRTPFVMMMDFTHAPVNVFDNYTVESSDTLGNEQSWHTFGTNQTTILGTDNPGMFAEIDTRTNIGFTAGVPQAFDISTDPPYKRYVIYNDGGFSTYGTLINYRFNGAPLFGPPTADFTAVPTVGDRPLSVSFTDTSTGGVGLSYYWEFGDGNVSVVKNPSHLYEFSGIFDVNHEICTVGGCDWENKSAYITVNEPAPPGPSITAQFTANITVLPPAPGGVQFTDLSTNTSAIIDYWFWEFGDTGTGNEQSPEHLYAHDGIYDVHLRVQNVTLMLEDWENKTAYIKVGITTIPVSQETLTPREGALPVLPDTMVALDFVAVLGLVFYSIKNREDGLYGHIYAVGIATVLASMGALMILNGGIGTPQTIDTTKTVTEVVYGGVGGTDAYVREATVVNAPAASILQDPSLAFLFMLMAGLGGVLFVYYVFTAWQYRRQRLHEQEWDDDFYE